MLAVNCSREGALRNRGFGTPPILDCCKFSLEGDACTTDRGTGSLEGRGIPEGLAFTDEGSIF